MLKLKEIKTMSSKDVMDYNVKELTQEAFNYANDTLSMNCCDKCGCMEVSEYLVWTINHSYCESCYNKFKRKPKLWTLGE